MLVCACRPVCCWGALLARCLYTPPPPPSPPLEALHNKVRNGKSQSLKSTPLLLSLSYSLSLRISNGVDHKQHAEQGGKKLKKKK